MAFTRVFFVFGLLINCIVAYRLYTLSDHDLVNTYTMMWPDSFDWIVNGIYYLERWRYNFIGDDITVRQPAFPMIIALFYLLNVPKLLILLGQVAFALALFIVFQLLKVLHVRWELSLAAFVVLFLDHSFNSFRMYIMADVYALALLLASALFYVESFIQERKRLALLAACIAGIGSLFQLYVLFSSVAYAIVLFLSWIWKRERSMIAHSLSATALSVIPQMLWFVIKLFLFDSSRPEKVEQFSLLNLSFENIDFYMEIWPKAFLSLMLVVLFFVPFAFFRTKARSFCLEHLFLFVLNVLFVTALFFYQWQEARFTYYYYPLAVLLVVSCLQVVIGDRDILRAGYSYGAYLLFLFLLGYVSLVPSGNIMQPTFQTHIETLKQPRRVFTENIFVLLTRIGPVRNFRDRCIIHFPPKTGERARVRKGCYAYKFNNIVRYLAFRSRMKKRRERI